MNFFWPTALALLLLIPLLIAAYVAILRRRRPAIRYSSLSLVRDALPRHANWRRHLPFALFLAALACLILAFARPSATVAAPAGQATVILALDVSRSMCAVDIEPSRIEAAQAAALAFVRSQDPNIRIGIVAFAGYAELIQAPTSDPELLEDAIASLQTARRTAIGSAIIRSLETLDGGDPMALPEGQYAPHIIVLLTDGASNTGVLPMEAAQAAAARGVRVYTIGFGTENPGGGSAAVCGSFRFQGGGQGGDLRWQGGGGARFRRGIDVGTLRQVADTTGGAYYAAASAGELQRVFQSLPISLITEPKQAEISVIFTILAAFLITIAIVLALRWTPLL